VTVWADGCVLCASVYVCVCVHGVRVCVFVVCVCVCVCCVWFVVFARVLVLVLMIVLAIVIVLVVIACVCMGSLVLRLSVVAKQDLLLTMDPIGQEPYAHLTHVVHVCQCATGVMVTMLAEVQPPSHQWPYRPLPEQAFGHWPGHEAGHEDPDSESQGVGPGQPCANSC